MDQSEVERIAVKYQATKEQFERIWKRVKMIGIQSQKGVIREIKRQFIRNSEKVGQVQDLFKNQLPSQFDNIGDPFTNILYPQSIRPLLHQKRLKLLLSSMISKEYPIYLLPKIYYSLNDLIVLIMCNQNVVVEGLNKDAVKQFIKCFKDRQIQVRDVEQSGNTDKQYIWISYGKQKHSLNYHIRFNTDNYTQQECLSFLKQYNLYYPSTALEKILQDDQISKAVVQTHLHYQDKDPLQLIKWIQNSERLLVANKLYLQKLHKGLMKYKGEIQKDLKQLQKVQNIVKSQQSDIRRLNRIRNYFKQSNYKTQKRFLQQLKHIYSQLQQIQNIFKRFDNKQFIKLLQGKNVNPALCYFSDVLNILLYNPMKNIEPYEAFVSLEIKNFIQDSVQYSKQHFNQKIKVKRSAKEIYLQLNQEQLQLLQPYIKNLPEIFESKYMQKFSGVCYHWIKILNILFKIPNSQLYKYLLNLGYTQANYKEALQDVQKMLSSLQNNFEKSSDLYRKQNEAFQNKYCKLFKIGGKDKGIILKVMQQIIQKVQQIRKNIFVNSLISGFYRVYKVEQSIYPYFINLGVSPIFLHNPQELSLQQVLKYEMFSEQQIEQFSMKTIKN